MVVVEVLAALNISVHIEWWWNDNKNIWLWGHVLESFAEGEPFIFESLHVEWANLGVVGTEEEENTADVHTEGLRASPIVDLAWVSLGECLVTGKDAATHFGASGTPPSFDNLEGWINRLEGIIEHSPEGDLEEVGTAPTLGDGVTVLHDDGLVAASTVSTDVSHHIADVWFHLAEIIGSLEDVFASGEAQQNWKN